MSCNAGHHIQCRPQDSTPTTSRFLPASKIQNSQLTASKSQGFLHPASMPQFPLGPAPPATKVATAPASMTQVLSLPPSLAQVPSSPAYSTQVPPMPASSSPDGILDFPTGLSHKHDRREEGRFFALLTAELAYIHNCFLLLQFSRARPRWQKSRGEYFNKKGDSPVSVAVNSSLY